VQPAHSKGLICQFHHHHLIHPKALSKAGTRLQAKKGSKAISPLDSQIVKDGELFKIGKRTGTMRGRYYILRD
jgi:hypothetical protein